MNQYQTASWGAMAKKYNLNQRTYGQGTGYDFPPHWSNGWIVESCPAEGLFVSSAWFTPEKKIVHTVDIKKPCLWIFCIDCGDLIYSQQGKSAVTFTPITHVLINPQRPFHLTFPSGIHTCFTSVLVFDDFLQPFLQSKTTPPKISIEDAKSWETEHYNTPNTMLILEQIRWALRNADMPLLAYEGMVLHLLCSIARNYPAVPDRRSNRRNYVTWENEQKIYAVKLKIDENILQVPPMEELVKTAGMSESKLRLSFKNTYQIPLYDYIRREKMKRAMQLLSADHLSIRDISERCGYKNAAKFSAAFQDVHGMTPSEFRKAFNL
ncbi:helix-turn-helix transcriptional regulator [Aminipila butyrica]|uniref:Helix-turn-helix transcriptional regulator n=1 Tax=Aminipila butyrica TaxID=433296 RepID=A0A858BWM1_9FIRM|nr:AraC family transcriptional regulator [Aminipila butyrica]QIB70481.1 helix-turn-helix transcriptional regulator [Aminipila butyrica]